MQNWDVGTWNGKGKIHNMLVPFYRPFGAAEVFIVRVLAANAGVLGSSVACHGFSIVLMINTTI